MPKAARCAAVPLGVRQEPLLMATGATACDIVPIFTSVHLPP